MKKVRFILLVSFLVLIIILLVITGIALIVSLSERANKSAVIEQTPTIVLDCGHGGPDGGAVAADGTAEKDINLSLGFRVREFLLLNGFKVVMTREKDSFICDDHNASLREQNVSDLHNRLKIAESYENSLFISLHMNKFSQPQYWGSQLFYSPNHPQSQLLANCIRQRLLETVQQGNSRPLKVMDSSVYIIYHATHPALLLECGFMSNKEELERFKNTDYQSQFAFEVFLGIADFVSAQGD